MKNHLAQVLTGEGKSVIAAGLSTFFALVEYMVHMGLYNPYLAERDNNYFKDLFNQLRVQPKYAEISLVVEEYLKITFGDLREAMSDFLKGKLSLTTVNAPTKQKSILIIDE